jgi:hypothetical protein
MRRTCFLALFCLAGCPKTASGPATDAAQGDKAPDVPPTPPPPPDAPPEALAKPDADQPDVPGLSDGGPAATMSFFVTSKGTGAKGGNLGGLAGADKICQDLAAAVGAGGRTWHAYLSTQGPGAVDARDRIGTGPWYNARGIRIAANLTELHGEAPSLNADTALDETGARVPGKGAAVNQQDILTGSRADGTAFPMVSPDGFFSNRTCSNWTESKQPVDAGVCCPPVAQVGHFDRIGDGTPGHQSWNSAHYTDGCDEQNFRLKGGAGRLYCFAIN